MSDQWQYHGEPLPTGGWKVPADEDAVTLPLPKAVPQPLPAPPDPRRSTYLPRIAQQSDDLRGDAVVQAAETRSDRLPIEESVTLRLPAVRPRSSTTVPPARNLRRDSRRGVVALARVLIILVLLVNLLGIGGLWALRANDVAHAALADLKFHLTRIEALGSSSGLLDPATLSVLQSEVTDAQADLQTLDNLIPFSGKLDVGGLGAYHRVLQLGSDALTGAQEGLAAASLLVPPLLGFVSTITHPAAPAAGAGSHLMTMQTVREAQRHMALAELAWNDVLADRKTISPADVRAIHNPQVTAALSTLDARAPSVTTAFSLASALLDWSPRLFGLTGPIHLLLFNMDSDELRATGGFLGNYADLTVTGGALTSGIHLHDIYTLDCPSTNNSFGCPSRPLPSEYSWFPLADGRFGVRDSNLNPDFPTSAGLAANLYQVESKTPVDGVIALTPDVVESILRALGSVVVKPFNVTVTADNLRSLIHYYHQNPQIGQQLGVSPSALGTTANKVFDVLASQAIFAKLGSMTPQQEGTLGKMLLGDLKTKDIQIFVSNTRVQNLLETIGVAGQVANYSDGDSEFVVDTNDGASYANADIHETLSDTVTLDAKGGASHTLVVTHGFAQVQHDYTVSNEYNDLARVIVPKSATHLRVSGPCTLVSTTEAYHLVMACHIALQRGAASTLSFSWYVPAVTTLRNGAPYRLLVQRQAGAKVAVQVRVTPPNGSTLTLGTGPGQVVAGHVEWSAKPLTMDTLLAMVIHR